jgi:antagonist of KipI
VALVVVKPGMLTTVQDAGRWGHQAQGVPVAGPMDPVAFRLANTIAGNPPTAALLEVTLLGPELVFGDERAIAVTGAEFDITVDDWDVPMYARVAVPPGGRLRFGRRRRGARAYLAVHGGIALPPVLGSQATHVISAMGGYKGRPLRAGDRIPLAHTAPAARPRPMPLAPIVPLPDGHGRLRLLPGPQQHLFAHGALDVLCSGQYVIAQNSDRMGFRLEGPALTHSGSADIISDATPLGVLQVPASGQPILLMADRQTTGGYPKIATVITADLTIAGQLAPGDSVSFTVCSPRDALAALITQEQALLRAEGR